LTLTDTVRETHKEDRSDEVAPLAERLEHLTVRLGDDSNDVSTLFTRS
jgi:hypothetical protein